MRDDHDGQLLKAALVTTFLLTALIFTAYQTAKGYESAIGTLPAWLLAALCAGILGLLAMSLRSALRTGGPTLGIWLGCILVAGVSFAGNFNSFYTGFIKNELIKDELEEKRQKLDDVFTRSQTALTDKAFAEMKRDVEFLKKQLRAQVVNEGNPGLGPLARKVIQRIEERLGDQLTPEAASDRSSASLSKLADRYDSQIDAKLSAKFVGMVENATEREKALASNAAVHAKAATAVDEALRRLALDKSENSQADALGAIQQAAEAYSRIGAQTRASLPVGSNFAYDTKMTIDSDKAGNIDHSFNSAIRHLGHFAVWLSFFLALFIDLGVPLVIRLIHGRDDPSSTNVMRDVRRASNRPNII